MKKKIILVLICLLFLCGCKDENKEEEIQPDEVILELNSVNPEVYSHIEIKDLIKETNVDDYTNEVIDTNEIGIKNVSIHYVYKNKKYVTRTAVNVVDTTPPLVFGSSSKTVELNYSGDLCGAVRIADYYDSTPICVVEGEYDTTNVGTYNVSLYITDTSGNKVEHPLEVKVVEKIPKTTTTSTKMPKVQFADAYAKYKNDNTEMGIDVSKWQADVDFEKVRDAGATFVMMRIGVKLKSGDEPVMDSYYLQNIKNAKEAGLKVGVYLYSKALSVDEAKHEAEWVLNALNGEKLDLPIVFDWEIWDGWSTYHLSLHELNEMAKTYIKTVEDAGYQGMLYGSRNNLVNYWDDDQIENIWLAHYVTDTGYKGYKMWQFSSTGRIPGIKGDVDLDVMVK